MSKPSSPDRGLLGAIAGDVIGSVYEFSAPKHTHFRLFRPKSTFTDDSVLTLAVADALLHDRDYFKFVQQYARTYPRRGYGGNFARWIYADDPKPYNSFGNGSAMRVSPVGWAFDVEEAVLREATASAAITHFPPLFCL